MLTDPEADRKLPVALLPAEWALQSYAPLWLGLRTGFLGSLSTFASWNLQLVQMICNAHISPVGGQISAAFAGYAIGAPFPLNAVVRKLTRLIRQSPFHPTCLTLGFSSFYFFFFFLIYKCPSLCRSSSVCRHARHRCPCLRGSLLVRLIL